jgi:RNA polymerase sigma-70 factor (ECF subfamily)
VSRSSSGRLQWRRGGRGHGGRLGPADEPSLLRRLRAGAADPEAWLELVERYGPYILAWCRRWGLQEADAADVSQTVLLKLSQTLRTFEYDPARRFRGLVRTIAQRVWADLWHAHQRAVPGSADSAVEAALSAEPARDDLAARLEAAYDRELLDLAAERVRARVEPTSWAAFRLTALEGRSGAEAAAALGLRVGTVFMAKSRVQQMLREEVARLESEAP